jgi:hypothetical protein
MAAIFEIDGVDYAKYIKSLAWTRNDIDASGSGRDKNGTMRRARIASKVKLQVTCRRMSQTEAQALNTALAPETVEIKYPDPRSGTVWGTFYGSEVSAGVAEDIDGVMYWSGISFNVIEV